MMSRRHFVKTGLLAASGPAVARVGIWQGLAAPPAPPLPAQAPGCARIPGTIFQMRGRVQQYLSGVTSQWLKVAPSSNPAMIEMFRDRDRHPLRDLVPWAGEFAGKYLVSAAQVWRVTGEP